LQTDSVERGKNKTGSKNSRVRVEKAVSSHRTPKLSADGGADGAGDRLGEAFYVGMMFGFDHDAGELFCAGIAKDDATVLAEGGIGFA
jgi:hypothetical protein